MPAATGDRKLQRTLYRQAKSKPQWKAWSLYGDVCRKDILKAALRQVIANGGAPGVDGMRVEDLARDAEHCERWLAMLESELRARTYLPSPVRRVYIPKADGKKRPLGIPTVRDRVVQTAVVLLLLPIFEADFHENSYAYRPKRRAHQAIDAIKVAFGISYLARDTSLGRQVVIKENLPVQLCFRDTHSLTVAPLHHGADMENFRWSLAWSVSGRRGDGS